jgi:hypothetical protein
MPMVSDIEDKIIGKKPEKKDTSSEIANRIWEAIEKHGYTNAGKAKEYIGDIGWQAVGGFGGYVNTCYNVTYDDQKVSIAQWRDCISAISAKADAGIPLDALPIAELEYQARKDGLKTNFNLLELAEHVRTRLPNDQK